MNADVVVDEIETLHFILGSDLLLGNFIAPLYLLNEAWIVVFHVAFFENYWGHFMLRCQRIVLRCTLSIGLIILILLIGFGSGPILGGISLVSGSLIVLILILLNLCHIKHSDAVILIIILCSSFCVGKVLMSLTDIFLGWEGEVCCVDYCSKYTIVQLVSDFLSVLEAQVVGDEPWCYPHDFNEPVLEHKRLASQEIDFENHLVCYSVDVICVDFQFTVFQTLREGLCVPYQRIFIVFKHGNISGYFLLGR